MIEQGLGRGAVPGAGHADAEGHHRLLLAYAQPEIVLRNRGPDALGHDRAGVEVYVGQDQGELVATEAGHEVVVAQAAAEEVAHLLHDLVASGMAAGEFYPGRPIAAIMAIGGIILFEFMLPDRGREYRAGTGGRINVAERGREMAAVINRAVVRPGVRLRRKRPRKGKR